MITAATNTWVIGDVQGCREELEHLLEKIAFDPTTDRLWFVGDLVNRGPDNIGVLDLVMSMPNVTCVLGNHDLHFLAVAMGLQTEKRSDTLSDLLKSDRLPEYIEFLRELPLIYRENNLIMVHAGLPPQLSVDTCLSLATEVEAALQSDDFTGFLAEMYGNEPATWDDALTGMTRLRVITNGFTRIRYCKADGELELTHKADIQPEGYAPWFSFGRDDGYTILFGHWAALDGNVQATDVDTDFAIGLDTGCVWGRDLTAYNVESRQLVSVPAIQRD